MQPELWIKTNSSPCALLTRFHLYIYLFLQSHDRSPFRYSGLLILEILPNVYPGSVITPSCDQTTPTSWLGRVFFLIFYKRLSCVLTQTPASLLVSANTKGFIICILGNRWANRADGKYAQLQNVLLHKAVSPPRANEYAISIQDLCNDKNK